MRDILNKIGDLGAIIRFIKIENIIKKNERSIKLIKK